MTDHKIEAEMAEEHASAMYGTGVDTSYWLQSAQVHAILYLAEQQRITNKLKFAELEHAGLDARTLHPEFAADMDRLFS